MTGTSLDGVDLVCAEFGSSGYHLLAFEGIPFPDALRSKLGSAHQLSVSEFFLLENEYSDFLADAIIRFKQSLTSNASFIGIHGQTIFHEPNSGLSYQMLNGGLIAIKTGLRVVCDFRRADVASGGQGAPLVPIGDKNLFPSYEACLNLGGFANISKSHKGKRVAFDICPCNLPLNHIASTMGRACDENGALAKTGKIIPELLDEINKKEYHSALPPKSLGREWYEREVLPLLSEGPPQDLLRTLSEYISDQVSKNLPAEGKVLVTGGGAHNEYLVSLLKKKTSCEPILPEADLIDGKEALIFAYLAFLRVEGQPNVLSTFTGGKQDLSAGAVYLP